MLRRQRRGTSEECIDEMNQIRHLLGYSLSSRGGRRGLGREAGKDIGNTLGKDMGNTLALHPPAEERPAGGGAQR